MFLRLSLMLFFLLIRFRFRFFFSRLLCFFPCGSSVCNIVVFPFCSFSFILDVGGWRLAWCSAVQWRGAIAVARGH
ncbi:hypothetical protein DFH27DRAFT_569112 [Peziza echinospora]|nr:hypothetical protein DFH27DRAFT_569112 [Peziza echinospora]